MAEWRQLSAAILALTALAGPAAAARPARHAAALTPATYRAALTPVQSCADFFARASRLPNPAPLLRSLFVDGIPTQGASESGDAFVGRVIDRLFARVGDPSKVVSAVAMGEAARYDPAAQALNIPLPQPLDAVLDPAGGGRTALRGSFAFPASVPNSITLPMTPAEAARFRAGAGQFRILSLFQDYGVNDADGALLVRLTPKCAGFFNGQESVPGWRFDGWTAAPLAS